MTGKKFDADNEGCNDNYGNFDYNYDKINMTITVKFE